MPKINGKTQIKTNTIPLEGLSGHALYALAMDSTNISVDEFDTVFADPLLAEGEAYYAMNADGQKYLASEGERLMRVVKITNGYGLREYVGVGATGEVRAVGGIAPDDITDAVDARISPTELRHAKKSLITNSGGTYILGTLHPYGHETVSYFGDSEHLVMADHAKRTVGIAARKAEEIAEAQKTKRVDAVIEEPLNYEATFQGNTVAAEVLGPKLPFSAVDHAKVFVIADLGPGNSTCFVLTYFSGAWNISDEESSAAQAGAPFVSQETGQTVMFIGGFLETGRDVPEILTRVVNRQAERIKLLSSSGGGGASGAIFAERPLPYEGDTITIPSDLASGSLLLNGISQGPVVAGATIPNPTQPGDTLTIIGQWHQTAPAS